jgi:hypothetical protein
MTSIVIGIKPTGPAVMSPSRFLDVCRFHEAESPALLSKRTLLLVSSTLVHTAHDFHPRIPSRCISPAFHSGICLQNDSRSSSRLLC